MLIPNSPELELELRLLYPNYKWDKFIERLVCLVSVSVNLPIYEKACIKINDLLYMAIGQRDEYTRYLQSIAESYPLTEWHLNRIKEGEPVIVYSYGLEITVSP